MAKTKREKERRKRQMGNVQKQMTMSGGSRALNLPEGLEMWKPKAEAYEIDAVPYEVGDRHSEYKDELQAGTPGQWLVFRPYAVHYGVGPDEDTVVCPAATFDKPCPVCEHRRELKQDPKVNPDVVKNLFPKDRVLMLVRPVSEDGVPSRKVKLWENSPRNFLAQLDEKVKKARPADRTKFAKWADMEEGLRLRIFGTETVMGGGGKYNKFSVDQFIDRDPLEDEILDHGFCLDDIPVEKSYDELYKMYHGVAPGENGDSDGGDDGDEESPPPARRGGNKSSGKKSTEDDEDLDEEPEDDEDFRDTDEDSELDDGDDADEPEIAVNDEVEFTYKGKKRTGTVTKINADKGVAYVEVDYQDKPAVVNLDELTLVDDGEPEENEEEEEPAPKNKKPASGVGKNTKAGRNSAETDDDDQDDWDEIPDADDDDAFEDDEDEPEEEEEPSPKKRGRPKGKK